MRRVIYVVVIVGMLLGWFAAEPTKAMMNATTMASCGRAFCVYLPFVARGNGNGITDPPPPIIRPTDWLGRLNSYRRAAGMDVVVNDDSMSAGNANHVNYLTLNPAAPLNHSENAGLPGHTDMGAQAAAESNLIRTVNMAVIAEDTAIDMWMESLSHRYGMLRPELNRVGFATQCRTPSCAAALNILGGLAGDQPERSIHYPGNDEQRVITRLISWQFFPWDDVNATLTSWSVRDHHGTVIPTTVQPALNAYYDIVAVRSDQPLQPNMKYTVEMQVQYGGQSLQRTWSFRTQ